MIKNVINYLQIENHIVEAPLCIFILTHVIVSWMCMYNKLFQTDFHFSQFLLFGHHHLGDPESRRQLEILHPIPESRLLQTINFAPLVILSGVSAAPDGVDPTLVDDQARAVTPVHREIPDPLVAVALGVVHVRLFHPAPGQQDPAVVHQDAGGGGVAAGGRQVPAGHVGHSGPAGAQGKDVRGGHPVVVVVVQVGVESVSRGEELVLRDLQEARLPKGAVGRGVHVVVVGPMGVVPRDRVRGPHRGVVAPSAKD